MILHFRISIIQIHNVMDISGLQKFNLEEGGLFSMISGVMINKVMREASVSTPGLGVKLVVPNFSFSMDFRYLEYRFLIKIV